MLFRSFRAQDVFSRLGGDEFVVLLPNLCENEARAVAERCRRVVADSPIQAGPDAVQVTISVGAVWTKENTPNFKRLLELDRKSVGEGKRVDLGGRRNIKKKKRKKKRKKEKKKKKNGDH